jgi:hypothetical protein
MSGNAAILWKPPSSDPGIIEQQRHRAKYARLILFGFVLIIIALAVLKGR